MPGEDLAFICPCLNEEGSIGDVVVSWLDEARHLQHRAVFVVGDNGSSDQTASVARRAGAIVVEAPRRGYGSACLAALDAPVVRGARFVVFVDGDGAGDPADLGALLAPLHTMPAPAMVLGSRTTGAGLGFVEPGAMTAAQRAGSVVAFVALRLLYGVVATDLGPLRAIDRRVLDRLQMDDPDFGWTVQMQARLARLNADVVEVPVRWRRRRAGASKVSGDLRASVKAAEVILRTLWRERHWQPARRSPGADDAPATR